MQQRLKSRKYFNPQSEEKKSIAIQTKRGYIFIEDVESHLHPTFTSSFYRRMYSLYLRRVKRIYGHRECPVKIFVASKKEIDDKMDTINQRVKK